MLLRILAIVLMGAIVGPSAFGADVAGASNTSAAAKAKEEPVAAVIENGVAEIRLVRDGDRSWYGSPVEVKLKKEPPHEGALITATLVGMPGKAIVALDVVTKNLYFDANNNYDLTDDPPVTEAEPGFTWGAKGIAKDLGILLNTPCWQGVLNDGGEEYRFIISGFSGALIEGCDAVYVTRRDHSLSCYGLAPPRSLYLNGKSYAVSYRMEGEGEARVRVMRLDETKPEMGHIALSGYVSGFYLKSDPPNATLAIVESSCNQAEVPAGVYNGGQCFYRVSSTLQEGAYAAYSEVEKTLEVRAGETVSLSQGAPLRAELKPELRGNRLFLGHNVLGVSGEGIKGRATPVVAVSGSTVSREIKIQYG